MTATIYPGRVMQLDPAGPLVMVPQLGQGVLWGPLADMSTPPLAVGEQVAVANLGASRDQLLILGRIRGRVPELEEIPGLDARLDSLDAEQDVQDARATAIEGVNTTQHNRLTSVEGRATNLEGRAGSLEGRATATEALGVAQTSRLDGIDTLNITQNNRLTATEGVASGAAAGLTTLRGDTAGKVTTKGDLLIATASGVLARRAAPADGMLLVPDSTSPDGWAAKDVLGMPKALTGATAATRYVGATTSGAPTTGAFLAGDFVLARDTGDTWICTAAGTPGTWTSPTARERFARTTAPAPFTSQTYANIPGLAFGVEAGAEYTLDGLLVYNALAAADIKFDLTGPAMTYFNVTMFGVATTMTATDATTTQGAVEAYSQGSPGNGGRGLGGNGNVNMAAQPKGSFMPSAAGTIQLQGAQLTANATASTLARGSFLRLVRIA
jgi:hypothetical protein